MSQTLAPWKLIGRISVSEAAFLVAGVNPLREDLSPEITAMANTYELAISEAVTKAHHHAWEVLRDVKHGEAPVSFYDIWEGAADFARMLPTNELRANVEAVFSDPVNVPELLQIDPWYSATVTGSELTEWMARNSVRSTYEFPASQLIVVHELDDLAALEAERYKNGWKPTEYDADPAHPVAAAAPTLQERPLGTRERNTLLLVIAAACKHAGLDPKKPAKTAAVLAGSASELGVQLGETTIEKHLKAIANALEARAR